MSYVYLVPSWFFGYDVALEFLFALITLTLALFALKIYRSSNEQQIKLFGISFLLISISYFIQSIFNFLIVSEINEKVVSLLDIQSINWFNTLGIYTHMLFMTIGLSVLVYMTFKTKKLRVLWLILTISLLGIFLSTDILYTFFLFSSIYLMFLSWHFIINCKNNKQKNSLLIAMAFLFLLFSNLHFLISINHRLFYAIGHLLELIAYLLIFINFYLVRKK